jgi:hypothetical protein
MGTFHNYDNPASTVNFAAGDIIPIKSTTTSRGAYITGTQLRSGIGDQGTAVAVSSGATALAVTAADHAGRVVVLNNTAPIAVTLPTATGSGAMFRFMIGVAATTTSSTIKVGNATDVMKGIALACVTTTNALNMFLTSATSDSIALNGTTKGGFAGDQVNITDVASGIYSVISFCNTSGTQVTPFVAGVS